MDSTSYLDPVALRQQFDQAKQNLDAENTAYENLKKDLEEKILNADELQGDTAESLRAYAADYIMILEMLMMANEDDEADAEKLIQELNTEESPLVDIDTVIDGFETLSMLQEAKGKEEMYTRLADEYARAAEECILLRNAYRKTANDYRQRAGIEHEKVEMCQARVDRYDRIEANTKGCFLRSSEPRSLANTALDAMPGSFLNGEYQMDVSATWRLSIKVYQYSREHNLLSLRQFCPSQYNNIISSSYEIIYPEYATHLKYTNYINSVSEVGGWYVSEIHTYCHLDQDAYREVENKQNELAADNITRGDPGWISTTDRGRLRYTCTLDGNLNGVEVADDCSGFVTACLIQSGFLEKSTVIYNSGNYIGENESASQALIDAGFVWYPISEIKGEELQPGDIMVRQGHVQIFDSYVGEENNPTIKAYTWGQIYYIEPANTCDSVYFEQNYLGIWRLEN